MKILIATIQHYLDTPGGAGRIAYDEAIELRSRGYEVWMLAIAPESLPEYEVIDGIHLLRYRQPSVAAWDPRRLYAHQKAIASVLKRHLQHVDVVIGFVLLQYMAAKEFYGDTVFSCCTITSPARMEMEIEWTNGRLLKRLTRPIALMAINRMEANCLRRSHVVTAMSEYTIRCIQALHGKELTKNVILLPGWVETKRFMPVADRDPLKQALGWPTDVPVLFTLRRLEKRMGLDRLLDACRALVSEGYKFRLFIGGSGSLRRILEMQVSECGLKDTVSFLGKIPEDMVANAYAACDAFVLPTAALECFGLIALEALSSGRPVLATPIGAIPEIILKVEKEWLAASANPSDIATLLRKYFDGQLPEHDPMHLHEKIFSIYNQKKVLDHLIQVSLGDVATVSSVS